MRHFLLFVAPALLLPTAAAAQSTPAAGAPHVLAGRHIRVAFSATNGAITSVRSFPSAGGTEFIGAAVPDARRPAPGAPGVPAGVLWQLVFREAGGRIDTVSNAQPAAGAFTVRSDGPAMILTWPRVRAPLSGQAAGDTAATAFERVEVRATLADADSSVDLRIAVTPVADAAGPPLATVVFPVIPSIAGGAADEVAQPRLHAGTLRRAPVETMGGVYPSLGMSMQFMLVGRGGSGLLLAAEDSLAWAKAFRLVPGTEFSVSTDVENAGSNGASFNAPWPFVVGVYRGDWMRGAKRYRAWAVRQPWARRSPMRTRATASSVEQVNLWVVDGLNTEVVPGLRDIGTPADVADRALEIQRRTGAHLGVHWYRWSGNLFDADYPNYFPTRDGFAAAAKRLTDAGIVAMPYINGRLWDTSTANFPAARAAATKAVDGRVNTEVYRTSGRIQAVMCPATPLWQRTLDTTVKRLGDEDGINTVYIDQIAAAAPKPCYDPSHGHPLGGGSWWVAGYRVLLAGIRASAQSAGRDLALTTELTAEPYMDGVDGFLIQTPRSSDDIPLLTAVYSGYTVYLGTPEPLEHGDVAWAAGVGRDWTWGDVPGWMYPHHLLEPGNARKLEYLGTLARARTRGAPWLVRGELLGFLPVDPSLPTVTGDWSGLGWGGHTSGPPRPFRLPVVHDAVWRAADGSLGVVATNADSVAHTFAFQIDCARWRCPPAPLRIWHLGEGSEAQSRAERRRSFTDSVTIPARGAVIIAVRGGARR